MFARRLEAVMLMQPSYNQGTYITLIIVRTSGRDVLVTRDPAIHQYDVTWRWDRPVDEG